MFVDVPHVHDNPGISFANRFRVVLFDYKHRIVPKRLRFLADVLFYPFTHVTLNLLRLRLWQWELVGVDGGGVGLHWNLIGGTPVGAHFELRRADRVVVLKQ